MLRSKPDMKYATKKYETAKNNTIEHSRNGTAELNRKSEKLCKYNSLIAEQTAE